MNKDCILRVHLNAAFKGKPALTDIRFDLQPGEVLGMVGSSGAGKSTLVLSLLGLLPWRGGSITGEVTFAGRNLLTLNEHQLRSIRGSQIAFIPQSPMTALNPALSLEAHFFEAWRAHERSGRDAMMVRLVPLLREVQLPTELAFLRRRPQQISVGQAQRVLIAMALLHRPKVVIADEPTSALDPVTQRQIIELLRSLNRTYGTALLYISHDLLSILQLCDRIAVLDHGRLVETLPVAALDGAQHRATRALIESLPIPLGLILKATGGYLSCSNSPPHGSLFTQILDPSVANDGISAGTPHATHSA